MNTDDFERSADQAREQRRHLLTDYPELRWLLICLASVCGMVLVATLVTLL